MEQHRLRSKRKPIYRRFFLGEDLRLVLVRLLSCRRLVDLNMRLDAPRSSDLVVRLRLAAKAAPAAFCCFFDFEGI